MSFFVQMWKIITTYPELLLKSAWTTIWIALVSVAAGTLLGALIAFVQYQRIPVLHRIVGIFVNIIRGTPLLLQLLIFSTGLFTIFNSMGIWIDNIYWCLIALILNSSAYVSEIFRAGIQSVDKGQSEAAKSLGMSDRNMMLRIIFPQAFKNVIPALGNEFVSMLKETSLVSTFFIGELITFYNVIKSLTYIIMPTLMIVGIVYYLLTTIITFGLKHLEARLAVSD